MGARARRLCARQVRFHFVANSHALPAADPQRIAEPELLAVADALTVAVSHGDAVSQQQPVGQSNRHGVSLSDAQCDGDAECLPDRDAVRICDDIAGAYTLADCQCELLTHAVGNCDAQRIAVCQHDGNALHVRHALSHAVGHAQRHRVAVSDSLLQRVRHPQHVSHGERDADCVEHENCLAQCNEYA